MERFSVVVGCVFILTTVTNGAIITFDDLVNSVTSYGFDDNSDTLDDVVFTAPGTSSFSSTGLWSNQTFVNGPGLGGMSALTEEVRIDFSMGAQDTLSLGFAIESETPGDAVSFSVYNAFDTQLGSASVIDLFSSYPFGRSDYPEGRMSPIFSGTASYATIDLVSGKSDYAVDNLAGVYGIGETRGIPMGEALLLGGLGMALIGWFRYHEA